MFTGGPLSSYLAFFLAITCTLSLSPVALAALEVVAHDVFVDLAQQRTTFTLTFNQPPDFFGVGESGQPNSAFQFLYDAEPLDGEIGFTGEDVVVIRGAEVRFANTIPIRDSLNPSGEEFPHAEGWGEILGEVEFEVDGQAVSFTVPWDVLGETDDRFGYRLFGLEQGELTSEAEFLHPRVLIPLPPALFGGAMVLGAAFVRRGI